MRFWWLSDCNCSGPLHARACCGVRKERTRPGLATSLRAKFRCGEAKKSVTKMAEQPECTREGVTKGTLRASDDTTTVAESTTPTPD